MPDDFFAFLRNSLSRLAVEVPDAHRALARTMGDLRARQLAEEAEEARREELRNIAENVILLDDYRS